MYHRPLWLPNHCCVDGEPQQVLTDLYDIFAKDFKSGAIVLMRMRVSWDQRILDGGSYEEGFWHIITRRDHSSGERLFDPRRAERLPWCRPTIINAEDPVAVKVWDYSEGRGNVRTYVWLENWDYVVIFQKRCTKKGAVAFLVTAYHIDGSYTRASMKRKYEKRVA
jgi:hypothetical protein